MFFPLEAKPLCLFVDGVDVKCVLRLAKELPLQTLDAYVNYINMDDQRVDH